MGARIRITPTVSHPRPRPARFRELDTELDSRTVPTPHDTRTAAQWALDAAAINIIRTQYGGYHHMCIHRVLLHARRGSLLARQSCSATVMGRLRLMMSQHNTGDQSRNELLVSGVSVLLEEAARRLARILLRLHREDDRRAVVDDDGHADGPGQPGRIGRADRACCCCVTNRVAGRGGGQQENGHVPHEPLHQRARRRLGRSAISEMRRGDPDEDRRRRSSATMQEPLRARAGGGVQAGRIHEGDSLNMQMHTTLHGNSITP